MIRCEDVRRPTVWEKLFQAFDSALHSFIDELDVIEIDGGIGPMRVTVGVAAQEVHKNDQTIPIE